MKNRVFLLTLAVLTLAVLAVSFTFITFSQNERTRLLDEQLQVIAGSVLSSNINMDRMEEAGDRIAEALGEDRIYTAVTVYSRNGEIVYRNDNGLKILRDFALPPKPERYYYKRGIREMRVMNLRIVPSGVYIQIALLLDNAQVRWSWATKHALVYVGFIFSILVLAALALSGLLIRPLVSLRQYLDRLSHAIADGDPLPQIPQSFGSVGEGDEFTQLAQTVRAVGNNLQSRFSLSQAAAAQMAHELKTPLTIIQNQLELARQQVSNAHTEKTAASLEEGISQVRHLSDIISDFLDWSFLRSSPKMELFAVRLDTVAEMIAEQLNRGNEGRIQLEKTAALTVFATEDTVAQVLNNLLGNALKFSKAAVILRVEPHSFSVIDRGEGIAPQVLERLGQPFNSGPRMSGIKSTGLGLAWVKALCDRYDWKLEIKSTANQGTTVTITVPEETA